MKIPCRPVKSEVSPVILVAVTLFSLAALVPAGTYADEAARHAGPVFVTIGTGPLNGVYYPVGRAICDELNRQPDVPPVLCSVERTTGSIYNLKAVSAGEIEFCLSQSDHLLAARNGTDAFKDALPDLRTVLPLFQESLTVVVRAGSPIRHFRDLKHKKVSTGMEGSGGYATMHVLMKTMGWEPDDIMEVNRISNARALSALCNREIDAVVFAAAHPYQPLAYAASRCDLRILDVRGPLVHRLLTGSSTYSLTVIPAGLYRGITEPARSFGVYAILVSNSRVGSDLVSRMTRAVVENLPELRKKNPVFYTVTMEGISRNRAGVAFHRGALLYFQEKGIGQE